MAVALEKHVAFLLPHGCFAHDGAKVVCDCMSAAGD